MNRFAAVLCIIVLTITAASAQDITPPEVSSVIAFDGTHVDVIYSEQVDSASAVTPENYSLIATYNEYDLVPMDVDSIVIEESHVSVRLHTVHPLSAYEMTFRIEISGIADTAGNVLSETVSIPFMGIPPEGFATWNDPDDYVIEGWVKLADGTPVTNYLMPVHNNGVDWEHYVGSLSQDDIDLKIRPDDTGWFHVEGLPSQPDVNMSDGGEYEMSVWDHPIYEPYGWSCNVSDSSNGVHRTFTLYPIVEGTRLEGTILDSEGQVIPFEGYSADDVVQITRGDVSVWTHPPSYTDTTSRMYYNPVTGEYHAEGDLGGGDYDVAFFLPGTPAENYQVNIPAGETQTLNVVLTPGSFTPLLPIEMDDFGLFTTPVANDTIRLHWRPLDDPSIVSYVVGIWHSSQVLYDASADSFWTRIAPSVLHVAVPATDTSVTLTHLAEINMEVVAPMDANVMDAGWLSEGELYYWGVFASDSLFSVLNSIMLENCFTGKPAGGLIQLISPKAEAPYIGYEMTDVDTATVTVLTTHPDDAQLYYRVTTASAPDASFETYSGVFKVGIDEETVRIEAFAGSEGWVNSDTAFVEIEPSSDAKEQSVLPKKYAINSVYPNPFNPACSITISLPQTSPLTVAVYDILGRQVATLANNDMVSAGVVRYNFDGSHLASGIYFVRVAVPGKLHEVRKIVLMR